MLVAPKVSVVMITYQHEKYIQQAIEGVLMQECNFVVELIIADDCSPDNTEEIVKKIIKEHPKGNWIKYTKHPKNKGMMPNFIWALQQAKGKYIALCEGDDYWTGPLKLQKQVDFLEEHEEYVICGHNRNKVDEFGNNIKSVIKIRELTTLTVVFRNNLFSELFFKKLKLVINGDLFLFLYLEQFGKSKILDFTGANYRIHSGGIWSLKNYKEQHKQIIISYQHILEYFETIQNKFLYKKVYKNIAHLKVDYGYILIKKSLYKKALLQVFKFNVIFLRTDLRENFTLILKINLIYCQTFFRKLIFNK